MKKFQKSAIAALSTMAMLLGSVPAAFADEAVTPAAAPAAQEVQAASGVVTPLALAYGNVGDPSTYYYFGGVTTINVYGVPGGVYTVYAIDQNGSYIDIGAGQITYQGSVTTQLWGYHKIYVSSSFPGTFSFNY